MHVHNLTDEPIDRVVAFVYGATETSEAFGDRLGFSLLRCSSPIFDVVAEEVLNKCFNKKRCGASQEANLELFDSIIILNFMEVRHWLRYTCIRVVCVTARLQ